MAEATKAPTSPQTSAAGSGEAPAYRDLSGDEASEFLAGATSRGVYLEAVEDFVKSDSILRVFSMTSGPFKGKKPRAMRAGFNTAIKNANQVGKIKVVARKDGIGLSRS